MFDFSPFNKLTPWRNGNASDSRPEDWGSIPSGVNFFTTRRHRVRVVKEVDLLGSARASANLVDGDQSLFFFNGEKNDSDEISTRRAQ